MRCNDAGVAEVGCDHPLMRDFKKIIAWQKAHALSVAMTSLADPQRFRARPRLRSQLLRAVDAVGAQISEGAGKPSEAEFGRYLDMAMATARETENHLLLARDNRLSRSRSCRPMSRAAR
ncbi:hypothetical protein BH11GEM1_BH11GEM1_00400 [soil metagenome]